MPFLPQSAALRGTLYAAPALVGLNYAVNKYVGDFLKQKVEKYDRNFLGTDIEIGRVDLCLHRARVTLKDVRLLNPRDVPDVETLFVEPPPAGRESDVSAPTMYNFEGDNLISVGECVLDLDWIALLRRGDIDVEEFVLKDVGSRYVATGGH